jgi:hypothetical protein
MTHNHYHDRFGELQEQIVYLQKDLSHYRRLVLRWGEEQLQKLGAPRDLLDYPLAPTTVAARRAWEKKLLWGVIAAAHAVATRRNADSPRARCPLCDAQPDNAYSSEGFALPEGLLRHLGGTGNSRECAVMRAARELGQDQIDRLECGR